MTDFPTKTELETRAGSLELYIEGVEKLAKSSKGDDGWLKALSLALQDTIILLRKCASDA